MYRVPAVVVYKRERNIVTPSYRTRVSPEAITKKKKQKKTLPLWILSIPTPLARCHRIIHITDILDGGECSLLIYLSEPLRIHIYIYIILSVYPTTTLFPYLHNVQTRKGTLVDGFSLYNIHSRNIIIYRKVKTKIFKRRYRMSLLPALIN